MADESIMNEVPVIEILRSEYHPEQSDEGAIDPLGLSSLSENLAQEVLPGLLERQRRPRFLTLIVVGLSLIDEVANQLPEDQWKVDFWEAYEWMVVTALIQQNPDNLPNLPSSDKAKRSQAKDVPLNPERYLKTPSVFGFHGVYKFLARNLDIERNGRLGDKGFQLLQIWANEQNLTGFLPGKMGSGSSERAKMIKIITNTLKAGHLTERWRNPFWEFINKHLNHNDVPKNEKNYLLEILESDARRAEVIKYMKTKKGMGVLTNPGKTQKDFYESFAAVATPELKPYVTAVLAYEQFASLLTDSFYEIQLLLSKEQIGLSTLELSNSSTLKKHQGLLADAYQNAKVSLSALNSNELIRRFQSFAVFERITSPLAFIEELLRHHIQNQKRKPPSGKNPWVHKTDQGLIVLRPGYMRADGKQLNGEFAHFYRLSTLNLFLKDLYDHG